MVFHENAALYKITNCLEQIKHEVMHIKFCATVDI